MVPRQQVIDYVSSSLRSGFDITSIRSRLIASGYNPAEVNAAIDAVHSGNIHPGSSVYKGTHTILIIAMVLFLFIAGVGTAIFKTSGDGGSSSDNPYVDDNAYLQGNTGTNNPSTTQTTNDNRAGSSSGDSNTAQSGTRQTTNFAGSDNSGTSGSDIPQVNYNVPTTSSTLQTRLAIENKVNEIAASKPDEAVQLCKQINTVAGQQSCMNNVAQASEQSRICTMISDESSADSCLTSLALLNVEDVNLCKKMKSEIRFRQCVVLYDSQSQLETLQQATQNIEQQTLNPAPELTQEQIDAAYTVDFEDAIIATQDEPVQEESQEQPIVPEDQSPDENPPESNPQGEQLPQGELPLE